MAEGRTTTREPTGSPTARFLASALLVGVAYYAGAWFGVNETITPDGIAVVWPPNAVLLAAFLLLPNRAWPLIALAALVAEVAADVGSFPLWAAVSFGLVNLFESVLAAGLIRRFVPGRFAFDTMRNGAYFLVFGPLCASALAALLGAAVYVVLGRAGTTYLELWRLWWFGDALGLLLLTPLIVTTWRHVERRNAILLWPKLLEAAALGLIVIGLGLLVFAQDRPDAVSFYFTPVLLVPLGIWSAFRFGVLGAAATVAGIAALAVGHLVRGIYPYPDVSSQHAVWLTQEYLAIIALVSVGLAIVLQELSQQRRILRRQDEELQAQNVELEQRIAERTAALAQANRSLQEANTRLERLATTDYLTQLANRRHFEELAQRELRRLARSGTKAAIIVFDLDDFKAINDRHGHRVGDEVLQKIRAPVTRSIRPLDLCARSGGEEFVVLLADADLERAREVAERIRAGIEALSDELPDAVTASFGVAEWNGEDGLHALIDRADAALYRAKSAGRNRVAV